MSLLNDNVDVIVGEKITPISRYQVTKIASGGVGIAGVIIPASGQAYKLSIATVQTSQASATTFDTFLDTLLDGTTFTYTSQDPVDGGTYTCRINPDNPVSKEVRTPGVWTRTINARGTK